MNKKLLDAMITQLNFEIESAFVYLAMKNYLETLSLDGFVNWFDVQFQEEMAHAQKFMDYINDRGGKVEIRGFETPRNDFESVLEVLETSLAHEKEVTRRIHNLMKIAYEVNDYPSISLLNWYVDEQVEEEDNFSSLIDKVKLVGGKGLYMLDKELATRVFVPINTAE
ncbi:ferritin [Candidatus Izemoplasma sp. B36]|uniref:ferritin n=1 Tax=Candidatus Izemoplasma sp. B36 TaxID=3242468 RepID=UPI00355640E9